MIYYPIIAYTILYVMIVLIRKFKTGWSAMLPILIIPALACLVWIVALLLIFIHNFLNS